ncbi:glycosyltransferase [Cnuibacter physcomitrellae]|uniref:glycosyltransferase family protein n=1 Tax=Cnuibacter physcomitrellae TaxID=1619308 RepID=UPI002175D5F2|nr:glycosyltransferase [Cnuibacter physcomitrellae]MCS5496244.1 glycosyltransferase [Cnuibacter physcomitrellae]
MSTADLDEGKGDVYVALGLARALAARGWGVALHPMSDWGRQTPDDVDAVIVMLESFVPGLLAPTTAAIAWARNWIDAWSELPYLSEYDGVWASSPAAASTLAVPYGDEVAVVPISVDADLFSPSPSPVDREALLLTTANGWGSPRQLDTVLHSVAESVPTTMFGVGDPAAAPPAADHRGAVSYFSLPDAYRRSWFVLDDVIDQARVYGCHNSRLFESIAAGSIPITNESLGLDALGLEDVPTYRDSADLIATIEGLHADPATYAALSARLQEQVRSAHTTSLRAEQAEDLVAVAVARARQSPRPRPMLTWAARERWSTIASSTTAALHADSIAELQHEITRREEEVESLEHALAAARAEAAELGEEVDRLTAERDTQEDDLRLVRQEIGTLSSWPSVRGERRLRALASPLLRRLRAHRRTT